MTDVTGPYYSPESAAQYLDIPLSTITDWRQKGVGPKYLRVGRRLIRYTKTELDAFMASSAGLALGAHQPATGDDDLARLLEGLSLESGAKAIAQAIKPLTRGLGMQEADRLFQRACALVGAN